ncbi:MAG: amidohydrolase family protein [Chromatiales bacterium]|nr:amidohydrolase family protein [Chromatiales bacterium]MDH4013961.1 amidohydrolase family protein [Chromatiales bacterium]
MAIIRRAGLAAVLAVFAGAPLAAAAEAVAITGARVITMRSAEILPDHTVVVIDGAIASVGPDSGVRIPDGAITIDGGGRYLIPGLAEMHAHVPDPVANGEYLDRVLQLYVANGITLIRGMLGRPEHLDLRDQLAANTRIGPRLITSGPSLNGRSVTSPEEGSRMVREQEAAGYDFLKLHPGLSLAAFNAIAAEAKRLGMPFAGHVSVDVGLERTLEAGQASIDHLDGYMQALAPADELPVPAEWGFFGFSIATLARDASITDWAARTASAGVWNVPTQALMVNWAGPEASRQLLLRPEMRFVAPELRAEYARRKNQIVGAGKYSPELATHFLKVRSQLILALHKAGAGLLLGSDAPQVFNVPGFSVHQELELLVAAGLSPYEALLTGTANPAEFFGEAGESGIIAAGAGADFILLRGNPLESIGNTRSIDGVMLRGQWFDHAALESMLAALEYPTQ